MSLRRPPRRDAPSRVIVRILLLVVMALIAGVIIWAAVTDQRIDLTETRSLEDVDRPGAVEVQSLSINVDQRGLGPLPVILLHGIDIAGGVLWDEVIDELGSEVTTVAIDLPGYGLSSRIPDPGSAHTVAAMAQVVAELIEARFNRPVLVAGVGLGGEVGAELAVTQPGLLAGLVMIDVDFWDRDGWLETAERAPFVGRAITFAFETGGPFSSDRWAPHCEVDGWCPTPSQVQARAIASEIRSTTDSLQAFRETPPASLVPSRLGDITTPSVYIWSSDGDVTEETADRTATEMPGLRVVESATWKIHLDDPAEVARQILSLAP